MRVVFDDEALDDLQRIFAHIAQDNRTAAEDLISRIFEKKNNSTPRPDGLRGTSPKRDAHRGFWC